MLLFDDTASASADQKEKKEQKENLKGHDSEASLRDIAEDYVRTASNVLEGTND